MSGHGLKINKTYSYNGKKYDNSSINYIAVGMRSAHVGMPKFAMRKVITRWKLKQYKHNPSEGDFYFANWGYDYYNRRYRQPAPCPPVLPWYPGMPYSW